MGTETLGRPLTGIHHKDKDQLEVVLGGVTNVTHKTHQIQNAVALMTYPDTISISTEVPTGENGMMVGPITIASDVTLTVSGTLTIV